MPPNADANLLVGLETSDDAGVYRIAPDLAIVQTVDFFTPVVDDPFNFGAIAAANSLSDVYAMGAVPRTALNIVCFPIDEMDPGILGEILAGGASVLEEAGVVLLGGHSVNDAEPKYGLAVTGVVDPNRITRNRGAKPGDRLVLTKAIGTGIATTAAMRGMDPPGVLAAAVRSMRTLNASAARAIASVPRAHVHAVTDVTGFGMLGHLSHWLSSGDVGIEIEAAAVPFLPGTLGLAADGVGTGGGERNRAYIADLLERGERVSNPVVSLLCDPQTSGGLCIAVAPEGLSSLLDNLAKESVEVRAIIGRVVEGPRRIVVR